MTAAEPADPSRPDAAPAALPPPGEGVWVVLPTYNEAENLGPISAAILAALPARRSWSWTTARPTGPARSPTAWPPSTPGSGSAIGRPSRASAGPTSTASRVALAGGATTVVQMDADWSHDPAVLPALVAPIADGAADLVIGSRYVRGGGVVDWGIGRRVISRGGSLFARIVLGLEPHDLTGGFKAWRATTLEAIPFDGIHAGGYVFQIEMTFRARRDAGPASARSPITFRDRRVGQSKMSRRIIAEALVVVVQLRAEELRAGLGRHPRSDDPQAVSGHPPTPRWTPRPPDPFPSRPAVTSPATPLAGTSSAVDTELDEPPGVRVVLDARPIQEPDRSPLTAAYLRGLLAAYDAAPLAGESFALLLRSDLDDPTIAFPDLEIVGRRLLPPTHLLRSAALTIDPFVLRGASIGAAWRATAGGAAGAVYHAVGASVPLVTGLPVVVTLLDLAPWELARSYQRTADDALRPAPPRPAPA